MSFMVVGVGEVCIFLYEVVEEVKLGEISTRTFLYFNEKLDTASTRRRFNPLRPNNDLSQTSHCNIKGLSLK